MKTDERYNPEKHKSVIIALEHWHRYHYFLDIIQDEQIVLDVACGYGYGSSLLSKKAKKVYGVDIDKDTIEVASKKYKNEKIEYITASITELPFKDNFFDIVFSFETIEHINEEMQKKALNEIKRVLKPEGILVISTPNTDSPYYQDVMNKYHIKEFSFREFKNFISNYFKHNLFLGQSFLYGSCIYSNLNIANVSGTSLENIDNTYPLDLKDQKFIIAICSDNTIELNLHSSVLLDINNSFFTEINNHIKSLEKAISEKDLYIKSLEKAISEKDLYIKSLEKAINEKDSGG